MTIVEDTDVVVAGVRAWLADDPEQRAEVIADGATLEDALAGPGRDADVIVLDLQLGPELMTGRIGALSDAGARVVVYSVHVEPLIVQSVLDAGACAFLDKRTERSLFVETILNVAADRPHITPSMAGGMLHNVRLSPREREVLTLLFQGMPHASIARRLHRENCPGRPIGVDTVKQYLQRARAKIAASGRPCRSNFSLLARCIELGLVRPSEIADYRSAAAEDE
ncbi:sigma factor-like helix-turn-helix DNA-binding protein [Cryptosporangium sp. NPDC051539]|uniref:sigma factor-like helix-turn-helix DNA-binding protein n=1 Tax=Cryptosporangium sp. NPDC051539 TaxID=3363962 RepID=UPI0037932F8B